ncbi:MAG: hypothetical protein D6683_05155 [Actinomyces sp.]|nr:MAG: hypothetical protein D6683_05155 [Actinomyces sp.]
MAHILSVLNHEWAHLAGSPAARRAVMRWKATRPLLGPARDLNDLLDLGHDPATGPQVRRVLAELAPVDTMAARTLLQAILGGLCNLANSIGRDANAADELISLAWERIRTYPAQRPGSIAGNVLLDVRKRYNRQHHHPDTVDLTVAGDPQVPSPENLIVTRAYLSDLLEAGRRHGVSEAALDTVVRSRAWGESMSDLAAEQHLPVKVLWHRRWRAEARLRQVAWAS